jgi:predicted 3-demethylubiquinone-9 3-methyltransferase (glyoxalase superfamily)
VAADNTATKMGMNYLKPQGNDHKMKPMQKITPHLWFDKEAREAAQLYCSLFPNSKITNITTLHDTPSGDCAVVSFELSGQRFMALSAGPLFKFNPSVSFHTKCGTKDEVDAMWEKLSQGGKILLPLGAYPFSERYGWLEDKYGLSWQLIFAGGSEIKQRITPALMFVGNICGKTEEAANFYASVFKNSPGGIKAAANTNVDVLARYGKGEEPDREGSVKTLTLRFSDRSLAPWTAPANIILRSTKPSHLSCPAKTRKKSTTSGENSLPIRRPSNAGGSRISTASHGRSLPQ